MLRTSSYIEHGAIPHMFAHFYNTTDTPSCSRRAAVHRAVAVGEGTDIIVGSCVVREAEVLEVHHRHA